MKILSIILIIFVVGFPIYAFLRMVLYQKEDGRAGLGAALRGVRGKGQARHGAFAPKKRGAAHQGRATARSAVRGL